MKLDDRIIELMNRYIDSMITEEEQSELDGYLNNNADAEKIFEELKKSAGAINDLPHYSPPENIKKKILNYVESSVLKTEGIRMNNVNIFDKVMAAIKPKVLLPAAFAVVLAVILLLIWNPQSGNETDNESVSGYMGKAEPMLRDSKSIYTMDLIEVQTAVNIFQSKNALYVTLDKKSRDKMAVKFNYAHELISFVGIKENIDTSPSIQKFRGKTEITLNDSTFIYMIFKVIKESSNVEMEIDDSQKQIFYYKFNAELYDNN